LQGQSGYISKLDHQGTTSSDGDMLFDDNDTDATNGVLLQYGIASGSTNGHWRKTAANTYQFHVLSADTQFTYTQTTGRFDCTAGAGSCNLLTH